MIGANSQPCGCFDWASILNQKAYTFSLDDRQCRRVNGLVLTLPLVRMTIHVGIVLDFFPSWINFIFLENFLLRAIVVTLLFEFDIKFTFLITVLELY